MSGKKGQGRAPLGSRKSGLGKSPAFRDLVRLALICRTTGACLVEVVWSTGAVVSTDSFSNLVLSFYQIAGGLGESTLDQEPEKSKRGSVQKFTCVRRVKFIPLDPSHETYQAEKIKTTPQQPRLQVGRHLRIGSAISSQSPAVRKLKEMQVRSDTNANMTTKQNKPFWLTVLSSRTIICAVLHETEHSDTVALSLAEDLLEQFHAAFDGRILNGVLAELVELQRKELLNAATTTNAVRLVVRFTLAARELAETYGAPEHDVSLSSSGSPSTSASSSSASTDASESETSAYSPGQPDFATASNATNSSSDWDAPSPEDKSVRKF